MNPAPIIKTTILSLFGLLFLSCIDQPKEQDLNSIDTKIISGRPEPTKLSDIAESIEFVRLETRPDVLVGNGTVKIVDSLAVVYSPQSGVFVFDSRTGEFKHKILGFRDRGPQGYSGSNVPLTLDEDGRIILHKWDRLGVWNYRTGAMLDHTLPLNPYKYSPLFFMNDSLLVGNVMNIYPDSKSTLDLISYHDGGIVREYGFMEKTDLNPYSTSMVRVALCETEGSVGYTHFVHDFIYGIDKETLAMKPESVLNLGSNLKSNVTPLGGDRDDPERFVAVSTMCENDSFIFLQLDCVADETTHLICYEKATRTTRYVDSYNSRLERSLDHGFVDDLGGGIPFFPHFIAPDGRAYMLLQAVNIVAKLGEDRARDMGITETDNPVIMIAKLKK